MNFLDFVNKKNRVAKIHEQLSKKQFIEKNIVYAHKLMLQLFKEKVSKKTVMLPGVDITRSGGDEFVSVTYLNYSDSTASKIDMLWNFNYLINNDSQTVYSINLFTGAEAAKLLFGDGTATAEISIYTLGQSPVYFLPLVIYMIKSKDFSLITDTTKTLVKTVFANESRVWYYGAQRFNIYEALSKDTVDNAFHISQGHKLVDNGTGFVWDTARGEKEASKHPDDFSTAYREICKAVNGGATTIKDIEVSLRRKVMVEYIADTTVTDAQHDIDNAVKKYSKSSEQVNDKIDRYVDTVLTGKYPGVILCGAPGAAKAYNIQQHLTAVGYKEGTNLTVCKGYAAPEDLYLTLHSASTPGQVVLFDGVDQLVGPKAQKECIAMLSSALNKKGAKLAYSTEEKLFDTNGQEVPNETVFNGNIIITTNYDASSLNKEFRGKPFVKSLDTNTKQMLDILKDIIPSIEPYRLNITEKTDAYNYIRSLVDEGKDIYISARGFAYAAALFGCYEKKENSGYDDVKSIVKAQLDNTIKLQSVEQKKPAKVK